LFHNSNVFGSCIIHILYTECAKIKKIIPAPKGQEGATRNCRGVCKSVQDTAELGAVSERTVHTDNPQTKPSMPAPIFEPRVCHQYTKYTCTSDLVTLRPLESSHSLAWNRIWTPLTTQISHTEHNVLMDAAMEDNGCLL